jgi:hypothetical protein
VTGATPPDGGLDDLLARLRARAADPERRTSVRPNQLSQTIGTLDLGGLLTMGRSLGADLARVVQANWEGRVDLAGHARAMEIERQITTPAERPPVAPATEEEIAAAEARLGVRLPATLRRVYAEVGDGGFGPGDGILPLHGVVAAYAELHSPGMLPVGRAWPEGLLPLVDMDPGYDCVDTATGRVVAWDPEELSERSSEDRFRRSFSEAFPSVEAWLGDWLGSKTVAEQHQEVMARAMSSDVQVRQARAARDRIRAMSPEERRAMGLPDTGWETVVWGGLGWDAERERELE